MMETEQSMAPPRPSLDMGIDEDALASQVVEIISGIALGALQSLEEAVDKASLSMEEGDDSVFYDDEDPASSKDAQEAASGPFGTSECGVGSRVCSDANRTPFPQVEDATGGTGADLISENMSLQMKTNESHCEAQMPDTEPTDPVREHQLTPEMSVSASGKPVEVNNGTHKRLQTQTLQTASTQEDEEKEAAPLMQDQTESQTPEIESLHVSEEGRGAEMNGDTETPEQLPSEELQVSGGSQGELDQESEQDRSSQASSGSPQDSKPGYSTLPRAKKSGLSDDKSPFNHHDSSKYNTVSYRKIRRGNTRQKIADFESMML